jgi:Recombination directionality factor-like
VCNPEQCPQYQSRQCNLSASFIFAVPDIKGLGLIELPTNSIYVLQKAYSAMQTVVLARGRLTGTRFWISKREFDITRIGEHGEPLRAKQMLTVLDAEIDIASLLDGADDTEPALELASRAVALVEANGNVHPLHAGGGIAIADADPDPQEKAESVPQQTPTRHDATSKPDATSTGSLLAHVMSHAGGQPDTGPAHETLEEKRHRLADLLQRLGLNADDRKHDFRVYAHARLGRGWTDRPQDVDAMNARLEQALTDRAALDREIVDARQQALLI